MVFNAVFNMYISYIAEASAPTHVFPEFLSTFTPHNILSKPQPAFPHNPCIVERMDSGERGMNPVAVIIINYRKEFWLSRRSNQRPLILKSCTLPSELRDTAPHNLVEYLHNRILAWCHVVPILLEHS